MAKLFQTIQALVAEDRYLVSEHAIDRLDERGILEWQVLDGLEQGELLVERLDALPNPVVEVNQLLADGTPIKAVWAHMISLDMAKLVTVHFYN
jgi:Domain of unknown function (DUF4258)